jgi:RNA polymerase sigma-70 factor (ECF subfamily)
LGTTPDLEARSLYEAGRAAWPAVALDAALFARHLATIPAAAGEQAEGPGRLHGGDLYLVCACLLGDRAALEVLQEQIRTAATRVRPDGVDELAQALGDRLLVARDDRPPDLAGYAGRAPLAGWLRVCAARMAGRMKQQERAPEALRRRLEARDVLPLDDPESAHLKESYRGPFEEAFRASLDALPAKSRTLLRLYHVEGLSLQRLAQINGAQNRSTAHRWLRQLHEELQQETLRRVRERLSLTPDETRSLLRLVASRLEVSIERHLASGER